MTRDGDEVVVHPTAIVEPGAVLGRGVRVGPFAYIRSPARIGDGCVIGPRATVLGSVELGPRCRVHTGAVLGDDPQDVAFEGGDSSVIIGADCIIRESASIHRGTKPGTATEIGDGCFVMGFTHLAHNVRLGKRVIVVNGALLGGYADIGDGAFISGNCVVHQFVHVGRLAMLGGAGGLTQDLPPFCTARPLSINTVVGLNVVGLRRADISAGERRAIRAAFKILYQSGLNTTDAVAQMKAAFPSGPASELWRFTAQSERGICSLARGRE